MKKHKSLYQNAEGLLFKNLDLQFFAEGDGTTRAADLVNPEVMAAALPAKIATRLKFRQYADVDHTLEGVAGDTITRPKYKYIGPAEDLIEGVPVEMTKMSMDTTTVTIKEAGKGVEITQKALLVNVPGTLAEAERQLAKSIADKIDIDCVAALETAPQFITEAPTSAPNILKAIDTFNSEDDLNLVLFINPKDYSKLILSLFTVGGDIAQKAMSSAQVAEIVGVKAIEKTRRVAEGKGYLMVYQTPEGRSESEEPTSALEIVMKRDVDLEPDYDNRRRVHDIVANAYYVANLRDDSAVVRFGGTGTPPEDEIPQG